MTKKTKITALIAALILLLSLSPVNAIEPEAEMVAQIQDIPVTSYGLPIEDIPEVFSTDTAEEGGFTERLRDEELQENTAVFRNADGTNTMLFYAQDIWYETEDGVKEDYNTNITETENGFENISGDKSIFFPEKLSDGVVYSEKGFSVTLTPSEDKVVSSPIEYETEVVPEDEIMSSEEIEAKEAAGEYDGIINQPEEELTEEEINALFDETNYEPYSQMSENTLEKHGNIILEWLKGIFEQKGKYTDDKRIEYGDISLSPLLHGVKQDTVITSPEKNSFSFKVALDGLTPLNSTGYSIPLADETGKVRGYINTEFSTDIKGDMSGKIILDIAQYEDGTYLLTQTVDSDFADSALIDNEMLVMATTFTISDYYIYDTYIFSGAANSNYNSSTMLKTGYYSGTYRTYIRFLLGSAFNNINPDSIVQEYLMLSTYSTSTATSITPYIPNLIWNNSTLTWSIAAVSPPYTASRNGVPAQSSTSVSMLANSYNSIRLNTNGAGNGLMAAFIREGINPNLSKTIDQSRGIVLINSIETYSSYCASFKSANSSGGLPYVTITYTRPTSVAYGTALPYQTNTGNANCLGYAIETNANYGTTTTHIPISCSGNNATDTQLIDAFKSFIESKNTVLYANHIEINDPIGYNEYRVAFRASNTTTIIGGERCVDTGAYHFVVQNSDGGWSEKNPGSSSHRISNPLSNSASCWTSQDCCSVKVLALTPEY